MAPEASDNWESQVRKGWLELAILASLWNEKLYGLDILRRLEAGSDLVVAEGTIYPILNRLKRDGLIDSKWVESEAGHPRKYYWLTAAGRRRTLSMAKHASEFLGRIQGLLAPLLAEEER
ncbi:MAG TPA: PadR family transcriptional regulator [Thermoanaerobaculia bacterium]